jgi:hypothetical protein
VLGSLLLVGAFVQLGKATIRFFISACLSVRLPAWNISAPSERIFFGAPPKSVEKIQAELTFWHRSFTFNSNKSPT